MATKTDAPGLKTAWFFLGVGLLLIGSQVIMWTGTDPQVAVPSSAPSPEPAQVPAPSAPVAAPPAPAPPAQRTALAPNRTAIDDMADPNAKPKEPVKPAETIVAHSGLEQWEVEIEHAIREENTDEQAVAELLQLYTRLPLDGKVEASEYLVDLTDDNDYGLLKPLMLDPAVPEEVLEVFLDDLYGRDEQVELPLMVEILKVPNHPGHEDAKETLEDYLEEDFGDNAAQWESAVTKWLEENLETE